MSRLLTRIGEGVGGWFCRVHRQRMLVNVIDARGDRYAGKMAYCPDCLRAAAPIIARLTAGGRWPAGARGPAVHAAGRQDGFPDHAPDALSGNDDSAVAPPDGGKSVARPNDDIAAPGDIA